MNRTLKVLGLGLFAALAMSAFAVLGASANITAHTGGHFTNDAPGGHALLHGEGGNAGNLHRGHLFAFQTSVTCEETYEGTVNAATVTSVTLTPTYKNCSDGRVVTHNGCNYTFTVRGTNASTLQNDVHFICPVGKKLEIHAAGECTVTFGTQTVTNAIVYKTITVDGKHAITADISAKNLVYEKHGLCEFLSPFGTGPHTGAELIGSATLTGETAAGSPVNITATGTNNH